MATVCYINLYESYSDRGAHVQTGAWQTDEVDESEIRVGERLPKWNGSDAPVVTDYKDGQLDLEYQGKAYTIKHGVELQLDSSLYSQEHGVSCYILKCIKVISTKIIYKGGWQLGDTIRQELEGPIGKGELEYPNGDRFNGMFHLNYAHINGPAYAAEGRYNFADGSCIEQAWIVTSSDRKSFPLHGVFRIHHPKGPDSIAMFCGGGKRYGFELFLPEENVSFARPRVVEWYANKRMMRWQGPDEERELEVVDYEIDESREGCTTLRLTLKDCRYIYKVLQQGGRYQANQYDSYVYEPYTHATLQLPNGDSLDHYGDDVRMFEPYDGYIYRHCAKTGMYRSEQWEKGKLKKSDEWKRDVRAAESIELPDPFGSDHKMNALLWKDGHIEYAYNENVNTGDWAYDGETAYSRPEGKGVLTGGRFGNEGKRYEGEFHAGRCHGQGVFVNEQAGIRQEGAFVDGIFQEPNAASGTIVLHARHGHRHWSVSGERDWEYEESDVEVKVGRLGCFTGFATLEVACIEKNKVTLTRYGKTFTITPDMGQQFSASIEGREWSDGCVYDGDDYTLVLKWMAEAK